MKSEFGHVFNHDDDAAEYDADVLLEEHPIRAGYNAVLNWVAHKSNQARKKKILDLGCGTGNLSLRLRGFEQLVCVDISKNMLALARQKLVNSTSTHTVTFVQADLLAYFEDNPSFEAVLSTYAIHHLTATEKLILFKKVYQALLPGGMAVFGDLMFADSASQNKWLTDYQNNGLSEVATDIAEEFFWLVDEACPVLEALGFQVETMQFSDLSWGITAYK